MYVSSFQWHSTVHIRVCKIYHFGTVTALPSQLSWMTWPVRDIGINAYSSSPQYFNAVWLVDRKGTWPVNRSMPIRTDGGRKSRRQQASPGSRGKWRLTGVQLLCSNRLLPQQHKITPSDQLPWRQQPTQCLGFLHNDQIVYKTVYIKVYDSLLLVS